MNPPYDPVRELCKLKLYSLAEHVRYGVEITIYDTATGSTYCVYKPAAVVNVSSDGYILLGEPCARQIRLKPAELKTSSGVSQLPTSPGLAWERKITTST